MYKVQVVNVPVGTVQYYTVLYIYFNFVINKIDLYINFLLDVFEYRNYLS